jgi:hypothetical protein
LFQGVGCQLSSEGVVLKRDISWIIGSLLPDGSLHCGDGVEVSEKGGQIEICIACVFAAAMKLLWAIEGYSWC